MAAAIWSRRSFERASEPENKIAQLDFGPDLRRQVHFRPVANVIKRSRSLLSTLANMSVQQLRRSLRICPEFIYPSGIPIHRIQT